jgi:hypothetical protein
LHLCATSKTCRALSREIRQNFCFARKIKNFLAGVPRRHPRLQKGLVETANPLLGTNCRREKASCAATMSRPIFNSLWIIIGIAVMAASTGVTGASNGAAWPAQGNLVQNSDLSERDGTEPAEYQLIGDVEYRYMGNPGRAMSGWGVALESGAATRTASVAQIVKGINAKAGRWYRFTFRGLPEPNFAVEQGGLFMKVEYFGDHGRTALDGKVKPIDGLIEQDRQKLSLNGDHHVGGAEVWRTYQLDFYLPFPEIDQLRISVGLDHGSAQTPTESEFFATDFSLTRIEGASDAPGVTTAPSSANAPKGTLFPLGGRWFYLAKGAESAPASHFDFHNADQLFYHDDRWSTPFEGEMTSWLRAGEKDLDGNIAADDTLVPDNVTIDVDATSLIIHTRGLPNHPTGKFPETSNGRRGNPNFIQEQQNTFYIPLNPKVNPRHFVTTTTNSNHALPMGPIGIAMNGIVFFNPFDMGNQDASNIMDFCCGHPNQDGLYHYHKYPICINSPWADEGTGHSPVIGWAFDGFPVYGPYERAGVLAKDVTGDGALNGFNLHWDKDRGWHYHVTPGQFPYIIGGYWGYEDSRDSQRPRHSRGSLGMGGGGMGGPPGGMADRPPGGGSPGNGPGGYGGGLPSQ